MKNLVILATVVLAGCAADCGPDWREIGLPYPDGYVERYANDLFLRKATVEYLGSARYDD